MKAVCYECRELHDGQDVVLTGSGVGIKFFCITCYNKEEV